MEKPSPGEQVRFKIARLGAYLIAGILLLLWLGLTPAGLLGKADAIGYAVCHRIDLRSFHIGERPLPLCARCSGMYLGAVLGLIFLVVRGRRAGTPPKKILLVLGVMVVVFVVDGLNSFLSLFPGFPSLYTPSNTIRLITGTWMGLVIAAVLMPAFNETAWQDRDPRPAIGNFRSLGLLIALGFLLDLVILTEVPIVLFPLALISAAGVLILLTMIYSIMWLMIFKHENRYYRMKEMYFSILAGFTVALFQIALMDLGRYLLTGTWEGFHFG
ncbi:MAG TPA: DUF2085 domain-containing protein [Anaerolineales bacterium]|nr:DUF2085 domain-containing protein [Anaerolineales bacterium]